MLGVPLSKLTWWVWTLDAHKRYRTFEVARRNGEPRVIDAPIKPIKDIQRSLADILLDLYDAPAHVHGFTRNRSPETNAGPHRRKEWVLRIDLADFFPSINFGRVRGLFQAFPFEYPPSVATLLAQICCHANRLPQGAPTSPAVSNFICRRMDTQLAQLARAERCHYTRYADDICFSTDRTVFPASLASTDADGMIVAGPRLVEIIDVGNGFSLNGAKTRLMRRTQRQRVTGLVVNEKANVPREYVHMLRGLLYIWKTHGEEVAASVLSDTEANRNWPPGKESPRFSSIVRGRVQHVGHVKGWDNPVYVRLATSLAALEPTFAPSVVAELPTTDIRIYTEGPSDIDHLLAASSYFAAQGAFLNLRLVPAPDFTPTNDAGLLKQCHGLSLTQQTTPCICVFDRDTDLAAKAVGKEADWRDYRNGVAAVALVAPAWRQPKQPLCIELLHEDVVLQRFDNAGRRLFLASEFNNRTGFHSSGSYITPHPGGKALVREDVYEVGTENSVGLAKVAFASAVRAGEPPYGGISFEGFRPTFEALEQAVRAALRAIR